MHGQSVGLGGKRLTNSQTVCMETVNQFVARKTYHKFLYELGGKAMHQKKIIEGGFGYGNSIENLHKVFKKYDIEPDVFFKHFEKKILTSKYENIEAELLDFLKTNGVSLKDAKLYISLLEKPNNQFIFLTDLHYP